MQKRFEGLAQAQYEIFEPLNTATENDGKMEENRREQQGRNDGAPSRSLTSS